MRYLARLIKEQQSNGDTWMVIKIKGEQLSDRVSTKKIEEIEIRLDDGRHISNAQRKKAYATIKDIADYTGYLPEECKETLKYSYICATGNDYLSLSSCSMDEARDFIDWMLETALEMGIPLSDNGVNRAEDIGRYLYACIMNKRCAVCGKDGEIHHVDAIGMGRDRETVNDDDSEKICLCRQHHTIAHQRGMQAFEKMYHVYGIKVKIQTFNNIKG